MVGTERRRSSLSAALWKTEIVSPFLGMSSELLCLVFSPLPFLLLLLFPLSHLLPPSHSPTPYFSPSFIFFTWETILLLSRKAQSPRQNGGKSRRWVWMGGNTTHKKEDSTQCFKSGTKCCFLNSYLILNAWQNLWAGTVLDKLFWDNQSHFSLSSPQTYAYELNSLKAKTLPFKFMYSWCLSAWHRVGVRKCLLNEWIYKWLMPDKCTWVGRTLEAGWARIMFGVHGWQSNRGSYWSCL